MISFSSIADTVANPRYSFASWQTVQDDCWVEVKRPKKIFKLKKAYLTSVKVIELFDEKSFFF